LDVIGDTREYFNAILQEIKEYSKPLCFRIDFRDARALEPTPRL